jgi:hypothetical protein
MEEEITPDLIDAALFDAGGVLFCTLDRASPVEGYGLSGVGFINQYATLGSPFIKYLPFET